jgi:hypothetical protein
LKAHLRNAFTLSSISSYSRLTWLLEIPLIPIAYVIAGRYSEDRTWVFGEVIRRLADEIEGAARSKLAEQLARSGNASLVMIQ